MMKKASLIVLMLLSIIGGVNALTFTDNFTDYDNQYLILADMNVASQWISAFDGNAPVQDTNTANTMVRDHTLRIVCDVSLSGSNACGMQNTGQQPHFDLTDWNTADAKIWFAVRVDDNSNFSNFEVMLGQAFGTSWTFRNTNPNNAGLTPGWNTVSFDLNSPVSTSGSPTLTDVNYILIREVYGAPQADYNMWINGLWLQRPPNEFNNVWQSLQIPFAGIYVPQGYALPFNDTTTPAQGRGFSMANNGKQSFGYHGRVFIPGFNGIDLRLYDTVFQVDINQVDVNQQTRITMEAENFSPGDSFTGCFVSTITPTTREVGVEEWEAGVKTFESANMNISYSDYHTYKCSIIDRNISFFVDGTIVASMTLDRRRDGLIGLEVFAGRQNIKNVTINYDLTSDISPTGQSLLTKPEWTITRDLFLPLILFLIMLGMIYGGIKTGSAQLAILGVIMIYIIYVILNALFFS